MNDDLAGLGLVELLERLEPIAEPAAVSFWPQTAGWFWLALVLGLAGAFASARWLAWRRANAYRRAALEQIEKANGDPAALAAILRRTALAAFPRNEVAGLYGESWLAFLDRSYGGSGFRKGPGRALARAPYAQTIANSELASLSADWVRRHSRGEVLEDRAEAREA